MGHPDLAQPGGSDARWGATVPTLLDYTGQDMDRQSIARRLAAMYNFTDTVFIPSEETLLFSTEGMRWTSRVILDLSGYPRDQLPWLNDEHVLLPVPVGGPPWSSASVAFPSLDAIFLGSNE